MEFVTQLWAYKSERFLLGVACPELVKNHVWLLLAVFKTTIVGCSFMHLAQPDLFNGFFALGEKFQPAQEGKGTYRFTPLCRDDLTIHSQLLWYYYWQATVIFLLAVTYLRILRSGVSLMKSSSSTGGSIVAGVDPDAQIEFMNNTIKIRREDPCK